MRYSRILRARFGHAKQVLEYSTFCRFHKVTGPICDCTGSGTEFRVESYNDSRMRHGPIQFVSYANSLPGPVAHPRGTPVPRPNVTIWGYAKPARLLE
jgi:hypothetical protein